MDMDMGVQKCQMLRNDLVATVPAVRLRLDCNDHCRTCNCKSKQGSCQLDESLVERSERRYICLPSKESSNDYSLFVFLG